MTIYAAIYSALARACGRPRRRRRRPQGARARVWAISDRALLPAWLQEAGAAQITAPRRSRVGSPIHRHRVIQNYGGVHVRRGRVR
jgi:hypothetical protein